MDSSALADNAYFFLFYFILSLFPYFATHKLY